MEDYLITHKKTGKTMLFKYNLNGFLIAFKTDLVMTKEGADYLRKYFPFEIEQLQFYKRHKEFTFDKLSPDLSFQNFWNTYNNKVGNKTRAERLWTALSVNNRAKALAYIKRYNNYLNLNMGITKLYPETYLNQKRFNND